MVETPAVCSGTADGTACTRKYAFVAVRPLSAEVSKCKRAKLKRPCNTRLLSPPRGGSGFDARSANVTVVSEIAGHVIRSADKGEQAIRNARSRDDIWR
jgi:hypothetical protein